MDAAAIPIVVLLGWIFSVCVHEYAHAITAWYGGDKTVEEKGYLDFNPFAYAHPVLSVVLPVAFLLMGGLPLMGGAVYIERQRLNGPWWESGVSAAGPASNIALSVLLCVPFVFGLDQPEQPLWAAVALLAVLNFYVAMINFLPVPGVDGFGILRPFLPTHVQERADEIAPYGMFILLGMFLLLAPLMTVLYVMALLVVLALGVPPETIRDGWQGLNQLRLTNS